MTLRDIEAQVAEEERIVANRFLIGHVARLSHWRMAEERFFADVEVVTRGGERVMVRDMPLVRGDYHQDHGVARAASRADADSPAAQQAVAYIDGARQALENLQTNANVPAAALRSFELGTALAAPLAGTLFREFLAALEKHIDRGMRVLVYCPTGNPSQEAYCLGAISVERGHDEWLVGGVE